VIDCVRVRNVCGVCACQPLAVAVLKNVAALTADGLQVLIAGGTTVTSDAVMDATVNVYDIATNTITTGTTPLSVARNGLGAGLAGTKVRLLLIARWLARGVLTDSVRCVLFVGGVCGRSVRRFDAVHCRRLLRFRFSESLRH
jgi:hypothetical protein